MFFTWSGFFVSGGERLPSGLYPGVAVRERNSDRGKPITITYAIHNPYKIKTKMIRQ
jgi:hypothetical protein